MLWQRVVTAVVLLLLLLPALFYHSPEPFSAVAMVFVVAGAWEWARLCAMGRGGCLALAAVCAALCAAAWQAGWLIAPLTGLWLVAAAVWLFGGAWLLYGGVSAWLALPRVLRLTIGLGVLTVAWIAVAQARTIGINYLLSVLVLVWAADIFAYFSGRAWGGRILARKLAPSISPGKSWEGVWGGMVGVLVLALVWVWADGHWRMVVPSLFTRLYELGLWPMLAAVVLLCALSVVGDLSESLLKRAAGVKDSSGLLPGHGGVLDRLDALLPTLPVAMLMYSLWSVAA